MPADTKSILQTHAESQLKRRNPALLLRVEIPGIRIGQDAHVSQSRRAASQKADITRRTLEVACWLGLECWGNNVANSHFSPGPFNREYCALASRHQPHLPCLQWRLAKRDRITASYINGQFSYRGGHPTCWTSSQKSRLNSVFSMEPGHLHSALTRWPDGKAPHLKSRHPFVPAAQQLISSSDDNNSNPAL